jgi:hypothetical protein
MTLKPNPTKRRWVLNFTENGRQRRLTFKTKQSAKAYWDALPNFGAFWLGLDDGQRAEIIAAWKRCQADGVSLIDCVVGNNGKAKAIPLTDSVHSFIKAKRKIGLRERSLTDLATSLRSFCATKAGSLVHDIKTPHIERFLDDRDVGPKRRNVLRGNLINFFNWTIASGYATSNPAVAVERAIEDDAPVRVLTPAQTRELLRCAMNVDPRTVPYFTLALFCGIRPAEVMALNWDDINLERLTVHVSPQKSKTRQNRFVSIPSNALEWLRLGGELPCSFVRCRFKRFIRPRLSFKWSQDVMRHSFASYHLALHRNEASTCYEMGDNSTTLFKHYRKLVTTEQAAEFFEIKLPS